MSGGGGGAPGGGLEEEHEEHVNHEAWVIPYADMVTLLMALFLMLFAISTLDLAKFEAMAANVGAELGSGSSPLDGGAGVLDAAPSPTAAPALLLEQRLAEADAVLSREEARAEAREEEQRNLEEVERHIAEHAAAVGLGDSIGFRREARGLVVTVVTDNVLFGPGDATLRPGGLEVLRQVAAAVAALPNQIAIEGHTDDRPIRTARFPSNWELSTERATSVLRFLVDVEGFDPTRVSAAGYGQQRPIAPNATVEGRASNRRVEVAILSQVPPEHGA